MTTPTDDHFEGKSALEHMQSKKATTASEVHGDEITGHIRSGLDAFRDPAIIFLLFGLISSSMFLLPVSATIKWGLVVGAAWALWQAARRTWYSWSYLERVHRLMAEEKYEIENNREQEREELTALYAAKGLQGQLLTDVIDVLMADNDRLLKVMLEEEMGLNIEVYEHPIKQGLGSLVGAFAATFACLAALLFLPFSIFPPFIVALIGASGFFMAHLKKNNVLSATIWNLASGLLVWGVVHFLMDLF